METTPQEDVSIVEAATSADYALGRAMFEEYARSIDVDLCFQDFAAELDRLSVMYAPPAGALLLAQSRRRTSPGAWDCGSCATTSAK